MKREKDLVPALNLTGRWENFFFFSIIVLGFRAYFGIYFFWKEKDVYIKKSKKGKTVGGMSKGAAVSIYKASLETVPQHPPPRPYLQPPM
jgi:hypothetical protein